MKNTLDWIKGRLNPTEKSVCETEELKVEAI